MSEVLARRERVLTPEETVELLRDRLGDEAIVATRQEHGVHTIELDAAHWLEAARRCREEPLLDHDMFDCLFGVDAREDGFDVVAVLYSTATGSRVALRTRCPGGREAPTCPSITEVYRGADWMERETWDMFGISFEGHPGLAPRILTVENFEGWPLRKDFHLASRAAKPWPGVKEPAELDADGNVIERIPRIGDAPGPYELDKVMAAQAKAANPEPPAVETDDADELPAGDADAGTEVAATSDADAAAAARDKADARRREQAEARRAKAAERAAAAADEEDDA